MTPQELKNSILQLAIQGKLSDRLPEDGSARELLVDISTDDSFDGQRVKQKIITDISEDDKLFDIPDTWEWIKLGAICVIARGGSPRPIKEYITTAPDGVNWIKIGDTEKNGKYISQTAEKIKPSGVSKSRMVHAGDFLLTNSMSFGRPYILKVDGCIHDGWLVISQSKEVFDQDYLYWMLSSYYAYMQFSDKVSGAVVKNLNSDKVANSVFPLPPIAEQKRIVAKIEELLPLIDRYEEAWTKLEAFNKRFPADMQKSLLQMAIQGKLVEQRPEEGTGEELYTQIQAEKQALIKSGKIKKDKPLPEITPDEIPFDIPETWKWVRLGDIISIQSGIGLTANQMKKGSIPVYGGNGITGYHNESIIHEETVVIGRVGFYCGSVHVTEKEAWITDNAFITTYPQRHIFREYLVHMLRHMDLGKNNNATAQPVVSGKKIYPLLIPLPPLAEQKRIVAKLEELLPLCERLK